MAKFNLIQNNFLAGELSKKLYGRVDLDLYFQGCSRLENAFTLPQGGVRRRPGSRFLTRLNTYNTDILEPLVGQLRWQKTPSALLNVPANPEATASYDDRYVYISGGNRIHRFDTDTKAIEWSTAVGSGSVEGLSVDSTGQVFCHRTGSSYLVEGYDATGTNLFSTVTRRTTAFQGIFVNDTSLWILSNDLIETYTKAGVWTSDSARFAAGVDKTAIHGDDDYIVVGNATGTVSMLLESGGIVVGFTDYVDADGLEIRGVFKTPGFIYVLTANSLAQLDVATGALNWRVRDVTWDLNSLRVITEAATDYIYVKRGSDGVVMSFTQAGVEIDTWTVVPGVQDFSPATLTYPFEVTDRSEFLYIGITDYPGNTGSITLSYIRASGKTAQETLGEFEKTLPFVSSTGKKYLVCFRRIEWVTGAKEDIEDQIEIRQVNEEEDDEISTVTTGFYFYGDGSVAATVRNAIDIDAIQYVQTGDVLILVDGNGPPIIIAAESESEFSVMNWFISAEFLDAATGANEQVGSFTTPSSAGKIFRDVPPFMRMPYQPRNVSSLLRLGVKGMGASAPELLQALYFGDDTMNVSTGAGTIYKYLKYSADPPTSKRAVLFVDGGNERSIVEALAMTSPSIITSTGASTYAIKTDNFRFGYWGSAESENWRLTWPRNWPRTVTLFQQRIIFGGSDDFPDTLWGSMTGNIMHMMGERLVQDKGSATDVSGNNYFGDIQETDPFSFTLASKEVGAIKWLSGAGDFLQVGTTYREYLATGGNAAISNTNIIVRPESHVGSSAVQPVTADNTTFFVGDDGRTLYSFNFAEASQGMEPVNVMSLADGIQDHGYDAAEGDQPPKILELAYQASRKIVWARTSVGSLIGMTYDPKNGVQAWHRHTLGGDRVRIKGMAVLPKSTGDDLYLMVWRSFGGTRSDVTIEKLGGDFELELLSNNSYSLDDKPWYSDSAIRKVSAHSKTVWTGFDHLEGQEVQLLVDGFKQAPVTVTSGTITLAEPAFEIIAGIGYSPEVHLMPMETQNKFGDSTGELKRVDRLGIRLHNTWSAQFRMDDFPAEDIDLRNTNVNIGDPIPPFNGVALVHPAANPEVEQIIKITQNDPMPMTLLAVTRRGMAYG